MEGSMRVRVGVRIRPLVELEVNQGSGSVCKASNNILSIQSNHKLLDFKYDWAFPTSTTNRQIYNHMCRGLVEGIFKGFNGTIFAYGQTGSGKSFTMGSLNMNNTLQEGVISLAVEDIFSKKHVLESKGIATMSVELSYLEVYMEECYDLLSPTRKQVDIREVNGCQIADGLTHLPVDTVSTLVSYLNIAAQNRATGSTSMNAQSSRSHAMCTVTVRIEYTQRELQEEGTTDADHECNGKTVISKLHLVDLAGSERAQRTNATGERFDEGVSINKGLLALGNVIVALANKSLDASGVSSKIHVPYRDSRLTRLLKDALGGNGVTVMLACVSPAESNTDETVNTLRFASRASCIVNHARANIEETLCSEEVYKELALLREQNSRLRTDLSISKQCHDDLRANCSYPLRGLRYILTRCLEEGLCLEDDEVDSVRNEVRTFAAVAAPDRQSLNPNRAVELEYVPPLVLLLEELSATEDWIQRTSGDSFSSARTSTEGGTTVDLDGRRSIGSITSSTTENEESDLDTGLLRDLDEQEIEGRTEMATKERACRDIVLLTEKVQSTLATLQQEVAVLEEARVELQRRPKSRNEGDDARLVLQLKDKTRLLEVKKREVNEKVKELVKVDKERLRVQGELVMMREKATELQKTRVNLLNKLKAEHLLHVNDKKRFEHAEGQSKRRQGEAHREIHRLEERIASRERVYKQQQEASALETKRLKDFISRQQEVRAMKTTNPHAKIGNVVSLRGLECGGTTTVMGDDRSRDLRTWISAQLDDQVERSTLQATIHMLSRQRVECMTALRDMKEADNDEIGEFEDEVMALTRQISDLQRQLGDKGVIIERKRFNHVTSTSEAKVLLHWLFEYAVEQRVVVPKGDMVGGVRSGRGRKKTKIQSDDESEYESEEYESEEEDEDYVEHVERKRKRPSRDTSIKEVVAIPVGSDVGVKRIRKDVLQDLSAFADSLVSTMNADPDGILNEKYLQSITVKQLQDMLRIKGLPVSGKKEDLIKRLLDNNSAVGGNDDRLPKSDNIRLEDVVPTSPYLKTQTHLKRKLVTLDIDLTEEF